MPSKTKIVIDHRCEVCRRITMQTKTINNQTNKIILNCMGCGKSREVDKLQNNNIP